MKARQDELLRAAARHRTAAEARRIRRIGRIGRIGRIRAAAAAAGRGHLARRHYDGAAQAG
ncbi:MAG TPA: hypothetical protein VKD26_01065 [Streptosporangiaceae bacterium]|nr:hypothetical protein [Streptosporangiaceae bacterium]